MKRLHHLTSTDKTTVFYYDETNNVRKLYMEGGCLNVPELNVFVLGGIIHDGIPQPIDLAPLREAMRIQKNADEFKLKHVAPGVFPELLHSTKLTTFLRWVSDHNMLVHYQALDLFFWSVVDVVDSLLSKIEDPVLLRGHLVL